MAVPQKAVPYTDVTKIWADDPARLPIAELITVVFSKIPVHKHLVVSPTAWESREPKSYPKQFRYRIYRCSTVNELGALLRDLKSDSYAAIVPGLPAEDWEPDVYNLRRKENIYTRQTRWMILDFDLLCPKGWTPDTTPINTFKMLWKTLTKIEGMPKSMPDCIWELSSGWGNPDADHPKLHLYIRLDNPVSLKQLTLWAKYVKATYRLNIDPSVFRQIQLIYTAAPRYIGEAEYVQSLQQSKRVYVHTGPTLRVNDLILNTPATQTTPTRKPKPGDDEIFQYVLDKLDENGMLLTKQPREGTKYDVICPIQEEHSPGSGNATSTTLMAPTKHHGPTFWCQHANSHGEKRNGWSWFLNKLASMGILNKREFRELRNISAKQEFEAEDEDEPEHRSNWHCSRIQDNYVYILGRDQYYDKLLGAAITPSALRTIHPAVWLSDQEKIDNMKAMSAPRAFMRSDMNVPGGIVVKDEAWRPQKSDLLIKKDNNLFINSWKGLPVNPATGNAAPFHEHMKFLCPNPEHQKIFTDFLAHAVQRPWERPQWAVVHVVKTQGIGRGLLHQLMLKILGQYATNVPIRELIDPKFDAYLYKNLWIGVEETAITGRGRKKAMEELKNLVTLSHSNINPKYGAVIHNAEIFSRLFFMTNHLNALPIDPTDRRFWICGPENQTMKPRAAIYYTKLMQLIDSQKFQAAVMHDLMNRDISSFEHGKVPEKTNLTYSMIDASQTLASEAIQHIKDSPRTYPPFGTDKQILNWIHEYVQEQGEQWTPQIQQDARSIIRELEGVGGRSSNNRLKQYNLGRKYYRFRIVRDEEIWKNPNLEELRATTRKYGEFK